MSERPIRGFSEMKDIYLTQILTEGKDYDGDGKVEDPKKEWRDSKNNAIRKALGKPPEDDYEPDDAEEEDEDKQEEGEKPKRSKNRKHKKNKEDKEMQTESFSNWRGDLYEVISKLEPKVKDIGNEQVTEKNVNNKVVLNPVVTEKFAILDSQELSEEFLYETAELAAEYFYNQGLNERGLEMVIDYLGEEKFLEYVFYVTEDVMLTEARRSGRIEPVTKTGKQIASLKGGAKATSIRSKQKEKAARREAEERQQASKPSGLTAALRSQSEVAKKVTTDKGNKAVKAAAQQQPKQKTTKDKLAAGILGLMGAYQKGMERHRQATQTAGRLASQTSQTLGRVAGAAARGAEEFGTGALRGAETATGLRHARTGEETRAGRNLRAAAIKGTRRAAATTRDVVARQVARTRVQKANESVQYILEKAVSEQQQKIFGLALAVKRGEVSRSKVSDKVLEIADSMSEAEIRKFASTKHKGIPHRA